MEVKITNSKLKRILHKNQDWMDNHIYGNFPSITIMTDFITSISGWDSPSKKVHEIYLNRVRLLTKF